MSSYEIVCSLNDPHSNVRKFTEWGINSCLNRRRISVNHLLQDGRVLFWGGDDIREYQGSDQFLDKLSFFRLSSGQWSESDELIGPNPNNYEGYGYGVWNDTLYIFGGSSSAYFTFTNDLFALNLNTLKWRECELKYRDERVHILESSKTSWVYEGLLYSFGGFSPEEAFERTIGSVQSFDIRHAPYGGYHNQLTAIDLKTLEIYSPPTKGTPPSPRGTCRVLKFGSTVIIYGGQFLQKPMSDFFILNLKTLTWKQISCEPFGPELANSSSMALIDDQKTAALLGKTLNDYENLELWFLDLENFNWTKILLQNSIDLERHTMFYEDGYLHVIGGKTNNNVCSDRTYTLLIRTPTLLSACRKAIIKLCRDSVLNYKDVVSCIPTLTKELFPDLS